MDRDLEFCVKLIRALKRIVNICEKYDASYEPLKGKLDNLVNGIFIQLPDGRRIAKKGNLPIHGLLEQIGELKEVAELLEMEEWFGGESGVEEETD